METKTTVIIAAVIVVLIAAVAVLALSGDSDDDNSESNGGSELPPVNADVRIGWKLSFDQENPGSYYSTPSEGMKFLAVHYTVVNDGYNKGVKLGYASNLLWDVEVDGVEPESIPTDDHPENSDARIMIGETGSGIEMFEVPSDCTFDDIEVTVDSILGAFEIGYDGSLEPSI